MPTVLTSEPRQSAAAPPMSAVRRRLEELSRLQDGWLDGRGKALPFDGLEWCAGLFESLPPPLQPGLYPTAEGGVRAEWSFPGNEASLDVDITSRKGDWHACNPSVVDDDGQVATLDLDGEEGRRQLMTMVVCALGSLDGSVHLVPMIRVETVAGE